MDERLERELDRRSLVVLSGPDSSGRTATACVALARRHGSPARVASFDLLPSEQLTDLTRMENSFIEGAGHLVQLGDARVADAMTLAAWHHTRGVSTHDGHRDRFRAGASGQQ